MNMLDKLIDKESLEIRWDIVETIPEFQKLYNGGYHHIYHREGNAFEHTKMVCEAVKQLPEWNRINSYYQYLLLSAALFHDIGKGVCFKKKENGDYSSEYHAKEGDKITRFLLWDELLQTREMICFLVRNHMKAAHFSDKSTEEQVQLYEKLLINSEEFYLGGYGICLLHLLSKADHMGSVMEPEFSKWEKFKNFIIPSRRKKVIKKFVKDDLELRKQLFTTHLNNYERIHNRKKEGINYKDKIAYVMVGVPGTGKSTFIDKNNMHSNYKKSCLEKIPVISRDSVRIDLGFVNKDGKFKGNKAQEDKVTSVIDKQLEECFNNEQSFYYDNINLKLKYRKDFNKLVKKHGYKITYIYCQTDKDTLYKRRGSQIPLGTLNKMIRDFDYPEPIEYDNIIYIIN